MSRCVACNSLINIDQRYFTNDNPMDDLCTECSIIVHNPDSTESKEYQFMHITEGLLQPRDGGYEQASSDEGG